MEKTSGSATPKPPTTCPLGGPVSPVTHSPWRRLHWGESPSPSDLTILSFHHHPPAPPQPPRCSRNMLNGSWALHRIGRVGSWPPAHLWGGQPSPSRAVSPNFWFSEQQQQRCVLPLGRPSAGLCRVGHCFSTSRVIPGRWSSPSVCHQIQPVAAAAFTTEIRVCVRELRGMCTAETGLKWTGGNSPPATLRHWE